MLPVAASVRIPPTRCLHRAFSAGRPRALAQCCPSPASHLVLGHRQHKLDVFVTHAKKGGGKKGGGGKAAVKVEEESSGSDVDLEKVARDAKKDAEDRMNKGVEAVSTNFGTIRTGRANPLVLDKVQVDYFGTPTPIKSLASVSVPDASTLRIAPFDRSAMKDIERAIQEADLGMNPNNDGECIRLIFPPMTEERRKELAKQVSKLGEEGKVAVRNVRKDVMKKWVDKFDFPKDTKKDLEGDVQKVTDKYIKRLEDMIKAKTEEILKV